MKQSVCFDDVLLVPQYSEIESRTKVDLSVSGFDDKLAKLTKESPALMCPIVGSPMDTVISPRSCAVLDDIGGFGVLHRYCTIEESVKMFQETLSLTVSAARQLPNIMVAIGATGDFFDRAVALYNAGCKSFCIDVAHGHHVSVKTALASLRKKFGNDIHIMTGNVATKEAFNDLADWGANSIRVGVGGGCFIPGTVITMGYGTKKPIEDVKVGDRVKTHTGDIKEVSEIFEKPFSDILVRINESLTCTLNHEIYVIENLNLHKITDVNLHTFAKWIPAGDLNGNYSLIEADGCNFHPIEKVETFHSEGHKIYDLTVEEDNSYVAEGYIVHNSVCTTRIRTGHGVPTLQSIIDCGKSDRDVYLVADGGIRNSGDIVKALAAGADMIMLGSLLAGHDESPGDLVDEHGVVHKSKSITGVSLFKKFRGMASKEAQMNWRGKVSVIEGESTMTSYKGSIQTTIIEMLDGIRSGLSYSGATTIRELRSKARFIAVTPQGVQENKPHGKLNLIK